MAEERADAMAAPKAAHLDGPRAVVMVEKLEVPRVVNSAGLSVFWLVAEWAESKVDPRVAVSAACWAGLRAVCWAVTWVALRVALSEGPMVALWVGQ